MTDETTHPPLNRRTLLAASGAAGATAIAAAVSGCASYPSGGAPATAPPADSKATGAPQSSPGGAPGSSGAPGPGAPGQAGAPGPSGPAPAEGQGAPAGPPGTVLGPASAVPVGGGAVYADQSVVVTQPSPGTFRAFSAVCTHQGCTVSDVYGGTINCPCHGSKFKITDGSVVAGPARRPLPAKRVRSTGGQLSVS
jgi:Rieske Fe-S protein